MPTTKMMEWDTGHVEARFLPEKTWFTRVMSPK